MSGSSSSDSRRRVTITVHKLNGETFDIQILDPNKTRVTDLKRSIAMQESIAEDCFDLATDEEVFTGPLLMFSLKEARIGEHVNLIMKESCLAKGIPRCLQCQAPHRFAHAVPLCRDCHMQQVRLLRRYEPYQDDVRLAQAYAVLDGAVDDDESSDDE